MNYIQFNNLSEFDKGIIIFENQDRLLSVREYYNQDVRLFDLGNFFVEYYFFPDVNEVTKIEGIPLDDKRVNLYIDYGLKFKNFENYIQEETLSGPIDDGEGVNYEVKRNKKM